MHVLIIPSWYPSHEDDVSGSFFRDQARALSYSGVKVGVLFLDFHSLKSIFKISELSLGINITLDKSVNTLKMSMFNLLPRIPYGIALLSKFRGAKLFKIYCKYYGYPDIIHVHSALYGGVIARYIKKQYGIPYVVTEHSTAYSRGILKKWQSRIAKNIFLESNKNIAVSRPFADLLNKYFVNVGLRWEIVPNILNKQFLENSPLYTKKLDKFKFLHISLLDRKKNVSLILRAFARVFANDEDVELYIGGEGEDKFMLEELSKKLKINDRVIFLGMLSSDEIVKIMAQCQVFVLSSNYETFGVVIIESLSQGLPVISTRCGGPEDILQQNSGILVDKENEDQMSEALLTIYKNYDQYNRAEIRKQCIEQYGWKTVAKSLKDVYRSILG